MTTILEAIGDYLQAQNKGTLGTNIFLGRMPETPDVCIAVYEYEGAAPRESFNTAYGHDIELPRIQVVCRATRDDYPTARDKAKEIHELLSAISSQTLSNINVMRVRALGSILPLGFDTQDRPTVAANFECFIGR